MKTILKEIILFIVIFVVVAFIIQADRWMQNPAGHILDIFSLKYGLPWAPLIFTFCIYFVLLILRKFFSFAINKK